MLYNTFHKLKISHAFSRNFLTDDFLPFKLAYKLFKKLDYTKKTYRNGTHFKIFINDGMGVMNFVSNYEMWLDNILPKLIDKEDAVFLDIGANTGQTMIKVLPRFPQVRYIAVEPNADCVRYLKKLVEINDFRNVKIVECALSDSDGHAELLTRYQDDILATTTHSFRKFTKYATKRQVPMTTGDALFKIENLNEVSVIKIDIEGGESKAIGGLLDTIKTFRPYMICEINPLLTADEGVTEFRTMSANKILSYMHDMDYVIINIITRDHVQNVEELSASLESCNYVFIPKEKASLLESI